MGSHDMFGRFEGGISLWHAIVEVRKCLLSITRFSTSHVGVEVTRARCVMGVVKNRTRLSLGLCATLLQGD